jgi:hypothetical protein
MAFTKVSPKTTNPAHHWTGLLFFHQLINSHNHRDRSLSWFYDLQHKLPSKSICLPS